MTAIVGIVEGGRVWMGADSAGGWDDGRVMARADPKLFRCGPYLIGFTWSYRMGQLIRYRAKLPEPYEWEHDLMGFMSARFVDAVRQCLNENGWATVKDAQQQGGEFLVGFRGQLFHIYSDYQVAIRSDGFDACGSGMDAALGSLHSTRMLKGGPDGRVRMALEAAVAFNGAVRPPFHMEVLE